MITEIEEYFTRGCGRCARFDTPDCSTRRWAEGLAALRRLCLEMGLEESVKWGQPCYQHAGRNIVIFGALKSDFRLSFFNASLLSDPEGILQRRGPQTRSADMVAFTDAAEVAPKVPALQALLREAIGHAAAGRKEAKAPRALEMPDELSAALDADPELAEAFAALTPGRQRSHVLHLLSSANPATRQARIARQRERILAGKGFNER